MSEHPMSGGVARRAARVYARRSRAAVRRVAAARRRTRARGAERAGGAHPGHDQGGGATARRDGRVGDGGAARSRSAARLRREARRAGPLSLRLAPGRAVHDPAHARGARLARAVAAGAGSVHQRGADGRGAVHAADEPRAARRRLPRPHAREGDGRGHRPRHERRHRHSRSPTRTSRSRGRISRSTARRCARAPSSTTTGCAPDRAASIASATSRSAAGCCSSCSTGDARATRCASPCPATRRWSCAISR